MAIETGYRHLDGALVYFNEHEVGQAIREKIADGTVKREDIFYCGKVCKVSLWWGNVHSQSKTATLIPHSHKQARLCECVISVAVLDWE